MAAAPVPSYTNFTDADLKQELVKSIKSFIDRVSHFKANSSGHPETLLRFHEEAKRLEELGAHAAMRDDEDLKDASDVIKNIFTSKLSFGDTGEISRLHDALRKFEPGKPFQHLALFVETFHTHREDATRWLLKELQLITEDLARTSDQ